jgi:hypothetical protein
VLLELTVAEQRFNAVMEVLRDGLTSRPTWASYAAAIPAGANAASLTSLPGSASTHRPD